MLWLWFTKRSQSDQMIPSLGKLFLNFGDGGGDFRLILCPLSELVLRPPAKQGCISKKASAAFFVSKTKLQTGIRMDASCTQALLAHPRRNHNTCSHHLMRNPDLQFPRRVECPHFPSWIGIPLIDCRTHPARFPAAAITPTARRGTPACEAVRKCMRELTLSAAALAASVARPSAGPCTNF